MRKKDKQTIQLMNERLRKIEEEIGRQRKAFVTLMSDAHSMHIRIQELEQGMPSSSSPFGPEPPVWSIVRGCDGYVAQRTPSGWWHLSDPFTRHTDPEGWHELNMDFGPMDIMYWAEEDEDHPWCEINKTRCDECS